MDLHKPGEDDVENVRETTFMAPQPHSRVEGVSNWDLITSLFLFLWRPVFIVLGVLSALDNFRKAELDFFCATVLCFVISAIATIPIKLQMYKEDLEKGRILRRSGLGVLFFVVILPIFVRNFQALSYGIKCRMAAQKHPEKDEKTHTSQRSYVKKYNREISDVALLKIFDTFLDAAPQKAIQLSILLANGFRWTQALLICWSLIGIAHCMTSYSKNIRRDQPRKHQVGTTGAVLLFGWHFCITVSRIFALALVGSIFWEYTLAAAVTHGLMMTLWIYFWDRSAFCGDSCCGSFFFSMALGFVYIFTYILPQEKDTRYRHSAFYVICGIENLAAILLFHCFDPQTRDRELKMAMSGVSIGLFVLGISLMIIYYVFFHPNVRAKKRLTDPEEVIDRKTLMVF